jgi:hypothetical protein
MMETVVEHPNPSEYATNLEQSLMDTAVESWRFARLFERLVEVDPMVKTELGWV